jgi:hypothetical protein
LDEERVASWRTYINAGVRRWLASKLLQVRFEAFPSVCDPSAFDKASIQAWKYLRVAVSWFAEMSTYLMEAVDGEDGKIRLPDELEGEKYEST